MRHPSPRPSTDALVWPRTVPDSLVKVLGAEDVTMRGDAVPAPPSGPGAPLRRGEAIGRYVVLEELGAGAMGRVYSAYDPRLDRRIALKQLRLEHHTQILREGARQRLLREAQALARLGHPHVVGVHDVVLQGEDLLLAIEHVDGATLKDWAADQSHDWRARVAVLVQAAQGLSAAHRAGIVHRDFKSENVMVDTVRGAKVVDFGLARALSADTTIETSAADLSAVSVEQSGSPWTTQTEAGGIVGTPMYMAPEQLEGHPATPATDQYALCVTAYEVLFGRRPFDSRSLAEFAEDKSQAKIHPIATDSPVPGRIRNAILRGLNPDPALRFESVEDFAAELVDRGRQRTTLLAVGAAFFAGTVGTAAVVLLSDDDPRCESGAAEAETAWNDNARSKVSAALATASSEDNRISTEVLTELDRYTARWVTERNDACAATSIRGDQSAELLDRRIACLDDRKGDLAATVGVLSTADALTRERAVDVAFGIPTLEACSDVARLLAAVQPPSAEDEAGVAAVRATLAQARTLNRAGKYDDALAQAVLAHQDAVRIAYRPAIAESLLWRGFFEDRTGDAATATQTLQQAAWLGQRIGHDPVAARAMTEQVFVLGHHLRRAEDGLLWAEFADATVERLGDPLERARLHNNRAIALMEAGRHEEARADYQSAIDLRTELLGARHPDTITAMLNLAGVADRTGQVELAKEQYENVLQLRDEVLGRDHPRTAAVLVNYGEFLTQTGEADRGLELIEQAVKTFARSDPEGPLHGTALQNLAVAYYHLDRLQESMETLQRALEIREKSLGPSHADVQYLHVNIGGLAFELGELRLARTELTLALHGLTEALGPEADDVAEVLTSIATLESKEGRHEQAAAASIRALKIRRKLLPAGHKAIGITLSSLANSQRRLGQLVQAQANAREAVEILSKAEPVEPWRVTRARWITAKAGHQLGSATPAEFDGLAEAAEALPDDRDELRTEIEALIEEHVVR